MAFEDLMPGGATRASGTQGCRPPWTKAISEPDPRPSDADHKGHRISALPIRPHLGCQTKSRKPTGRRCRPRSGNDQDGRVRSHALPNLLNLTSNLPHHSRVPHRSDPGSGPRCAPPGKDWTYVPEKRASHTAGRRVGSCGPHLAADLGNDTDGPFERRVPVSREAVAPIGR